jgi:hypothetical protein
MEKEQPMLSRKRTIPTLALLLAVALHGHGEPRSQDKVPEPAQLVKTAVAELLKMQEKDGAWPYEGVYRVSREIPVGYRVGGTAIVAGTLLHAAPDDKEARAAVARGLTLVLKELEHPLMAPSTEDRYDVRVWGHAYALEFLCQVRAAKAAGGHARKVEEWVPKLVRTLVTEEIAGGGWNYASRRAHASFVTAPVTQALLLARSQGEKVPDAVLDRARKVLEASRTEEGAFAYSGPARDGRASDQPPGSAARSAVCDTTLVLLGSGSIDAVRASLEAFYKHWDELEKRRKKPGTHEGKYRIAPYYFYYGHRYAAQAIQMLPEKERAAERARLLKTILKTRDEDGTWNDRVFARSRAYGSAMVVLALVGEKAPLPPKRQKK